MDKIRVLIADDHPVFREGLVSLLAEEKDIEVVAQAADGIEAIEMAQSTLPDVALIDISMPGENGIEVTRRIKAASPRTAVLVVSAYSYDSYVLGAVEAGAAGYLLKNVRFRDLVGAIRALHAGETVLDPTAMRKLVSRLASSRAGAEDTLPQLHNRELEVLKLAARGMSNKEVAQSLGISVRTCQTHLANIFAKLGVGSRTEAVLHALREGWITPDNLP
ncbi:MAG: response regulator transcription factor [Dehalococcoidia bacterium]|nr:response regulator transcription factor [Dehalococcoidia bacterium]